MKKRHDPNPRYAQMVEAGDTLYIAGQIADDFDADFRLQTEQVLAKIDALLAKADTDHSALVSCTVWLKDFTHYGLFNEIWEGWIGDGNQPARASVGAPLLDPRLLIEITAIAQR